jgi:hypothetical protein
MNLLEEIRRGKILIDQCKELKNKISKAENLENWKVGDKSIKYFTQLPIYKK